MQDTQVQSLGLEDLLEKEMAIHSSTLPWKIPWTEDPGRPQSMGPHSRTWMSNFSPRRSYITDSWTTFQFVVIHIVKGFNIVNKKEVDIFLKFSCFFYGHMDIGNLISGSSAFSKYTLSIWNFLVHVLLKPGLYYFASVWDECNYAVVWTFFGTGIGMKTDLFQSCGHCWVFQICWHMECSTFTVSPFRICNHWNSITSASCVCSDVS